MVIRRALLLGGMVLPLAFAAAAHATPGDIDPTFSRDGYTRIGFGDADAEATAIALDEQGRVVIAGTTGDSGGRYGADTPLAIGIARLTSTGQLDPTFSQDGTVRLEIGALPQLADVAIDPAGRIVIGFSAGGDLSALRLLDDGSPDGSFSGDGVATADAGATESGGSLLLAADGTATIGGDSCASGRCQFALARFTPDGAPDASFDGDGIVTTALPGDSAELNDLAAAPDSGVFAAGHSLGKAALVRYTDSGALDPAFGGGGVAVVPDTPGVPQTSGAEAIFPDASGAIVGVGAFGYPYRVTPEGTRDSSYGAATTLPRGGYGADGANYILGTGSVGGCFRGCSPVDTVLGRADVGSGALDTRFGAGSTPSYVAGWTLVDLDAKPDGGLAVTADGEHRPLTAGYSGNQMVVARFEVADGPSDRDGDGVIDTGDGCPLRYSAHQTTGCPVNKRKLTMQRRKRADQWVGTISSPEERCNFNQTVRVYRRQPGLDELTTRVTSDGDGAWSADGNLRFGQYYAKLHDYSKERYGTCTKARSNVVTIHR